jgi:Tfp pilus assembly protein PilV
VILLTKNKNKNKGFLVVEILVAVSIITVFILTAMAVAQKAIYVSRQALHATQASFLLEQGGENMRIARDNAWSNVATFPEEQIGIFTRTVVASSVTRDVVSGDIGPGDVDPGTELITVTVSWPEGGITITKTLQFYITNIF